MNLSSILALIGPVGEPILEEAVNTYWPNFDAWVASLAQADEKLLLQALSPAIKGFLIAELKKQLLPAVVAS